MPKQTLDELLTVFRECHFGEVEIAARKAITTHFDECCDSEYWKGYKVARGIVTVYELAPLTEAKHKRLDAHVMKLLKEGHAVTSFEDESGKKVVGVRVIKEIPTETTT